MYGAHAKMTHTPLLRAQHKLSATIHIASATSFIIIAAVHDTNFNRPLKERPSQYQWFYTCAATDDFDGINYDCDMSERIWYISDVGTIGQVPVMWFAFAFALWSGLCHCLSLYWNHTIKRPAWWNSAIAVRTYDYTISAPLMIVVINLLFGSGSYLGVIVAPLLQAIVIIVGGWLEHKHSISKAPPFKLYEWAIALLLFVLYALEWTPAFHSFKKATEKSEEPNVGSAPSEVWIYVILMFLIFSSFPVIWLYFIFRAPNPNKREFCYNIVSCIAKVTLHAFVAIALFGQGSRLNFSENNLPTEPINETGQEQKAYTAATGVILGVSVANAFVWKYKRATDVGTGLDSMLMESFN
jgi:hypothetical protein